MTPYPDSRSRRLLIRLCHKATGEYFRLLLSFLAGYFFHSLFGYGGGGDAGGDNSIAPDLLLFRDSLPSSLPPRFVPKTRYEVLRFDTFDEKWLFNNVDDDPKIGLTRHHKADIADVSKQIVQRMNDREKVAAFAVDDGKKKKRPDKMRLSWKLDKYRRGWRRYDPTRGEEHKMLLHVFVDSIGEAGRPRKKRQLLVTAVKPFAPAAIVAVEEAEVRANETVHFVVPVSRLSSRFDDFIANYEDVCLKELSSTTRDTNGRACVLIIVVFNGPSNLDKDAVANVRLHLARLNRIYGESSSSIVETKKEKKSPLDARLVITKEAFTRAIGMDLGARQLPPGALVFFVDVDVSFDATFVRNCQLIADRGKIVYYPIVFSQYDPSIVGNYSSPQALKSNKLDMKVISKLSGHWVVYGFGMVCLFKEDYEAVGGYDINIRGWGGEDVALYDAHVKHPSLAVWRACEPGLAHRFHERICDPGLSEEQFNMCQGAAAESLGSRAQLANMVVARDKKKKETIRNRK